MTHEEVANFFEKMTKLEEDRQVIEGFKEEMEITEETLKNLISQIVGIIEEGKMPSKIHEACIYLFIKKIYYREMLIPILGSMEQKELSKKIKEADVILSNNRQITVINFRDLLWLCITEQHLGVDSILAKEIRKFCQETVDNMHEKVYQLFGILDWDMASNKIQQAAELIQKYAISWEMFWEKVEVYLSGNGRKITQLDFAISEFCHF